MNIIKFLGVLILNVFVRNDSEDNSKRYMDKFLVKYWDFYGNYIGTEVCAMNYAVAMDTVSRRADCKSLIGWERI